MLEVNRAYGTRSAKADTEERGENPRRRNGTVNAQSAKSGHRFRRFGGFPAGRYAVHKDVCTKAFVALVLFVCTNGGRVHAHSLLRKE